MVNPFANRGILEDITHHYKDEKLTISWGKYGARTGFIGEVQVVRTPSRECYGQVIRMLERKWRLKNPKLSLFQERRLTCRQECAGFEVRRTNELAVSGAWDIDIDTFIPADWILWHWPLRGPDDLGANKVRLIICLQPCGKETRSNAYTGLCWIVSSHRWSHSVK